MRSSHTLLLTVVTAAVTCAAQTPIPGVELEGGAKDRVGSSFFGEEVNMVYARPTGPASAMRAVIDLTDLPRGDAFLHLRARDDDAQGPCRISIAVNDRTIFEGPNRFPANEWKTERLPIPGGTLRAGQNTIVITNLEERGEVGQPPWFMVAACGLGGEALQVRKDVTRNFFVTLPAEARPFPEPLEENRKPGFAIRGTKGWNWTPEQYMAEIPVLARCKMNFLMNCYLSMFAREPKLENRWWEPLAEKQKDAYAKVARACREQGINFCFAIHPQLSSPRPMNPTSDEDFEKLWRHFAWAQSVGIRWFSLPIDDVHVMEGVRISGSEHARLVNKLLARLREKDPEAQFIFCPTWYWGDGTEPKQKAYLQELAADLHPDVYLFWTGDGVTGKVTRKAAETFRGFAKHRLVLWDNYPVNDAHQAMHLGPVLGRDPDLGEVVDGYMSNPHCTQSEINRVPLLTCADYAWNPLAYDPARSIGQAIVNLEASPDAREILRDLVEAYPGMLVYGNGHPGFNSVRDQYTRMAKAPHARFAAEAFLRHLERLSDRMARTFPDRYRAARDTLDKDIAWVRQAFATRYGS